MKRKTLILSASAAAIALASITTIAIAKGPDGKWGDCEKGEHRMHKKGHHDKGQMGFSMMGGHHMKRFMKDGTFDMALTPERVKEMMEGMIAMQGNENLKVGEITTNEAGKIIAQLVTKDNSLVETFEVDPKTGRHHPVR